MKQLFSVRRGKEYLVLATQKHGANSWTEDVSACTRFGSRASALLNAVEEGAEVVPGAPLPVFEAEEE